MTTRPPSASIRSAPRNGPWSRPRSLGTKSRNASARRTRSFSPSTPPPFSSAMKNWATSSSPCSSSSRSSRCSRSSASIRLRSRNVNQTPPAKRRRGHEHGTSLCRHIRVGLQDVESRLLSQVGQGRELPEPLLFKVERGRGKLHLPPPLDRTGAGEVARRHRGWIFLLRQSSTGHHPLQAVERQRRISEGVSGIRATARWGPAARSVALPASARLEG